MNNATAINSGFDTFINELHNDGVVPLLHIVQDCDDDRAYYKRTRCVPVLSEDESEDCTVFGDWGTYYEFEAWRAYRAMSKTGNEFQLMVTDVLNKHSWSPETVKWIGIINGMVNVQNEYADKFGHHPSDMNKFIKSYVKNGADTVLARDRY